MASCGDAGPSQPRPAHLLTGQSVPAGPVVDTADILPPRQEAQVNRRLRDYWQEERTAVVVASVRTLNGKTIEREAFDLFNGWGIGSSAQNRGLLILVAPGERKVRIEVGCGLESVVTDMVAKTIIERDMIPKLRAGAYPEAITAGLDGLIEALVDNEDARPTSPGCLAQMKAAA